MNIQRRIFLMVALSVFLAGFPKSGFAAHIESSEWVANLVSAEGHVESMTHGETNWTPAKLEDAYFPEDRVRTLENSRAAVLLKNESILRLDQRTTVKFSAVTPEKPSLLELIKGRVLFFSRFPRKLLIDTPFVNAASEGTEFLIEVDEEAGTTTITVLEGQITAANEAGSVTIQSGQAAVARAGERPVLRIVVRPRDAVQWALYYPPVLSIRDLALEDIVGAPETDWRSKVRRSIDFYREGNVEQAFSALEGAPKDISDPRFYAYRASLLLSVGRVEEASSDLERALKLSPGNGLALALQSIIAVVQNEKDKALEFALRASEAAPDSVSAKIALSYAHQANFDLPQALAAVQEAVKLDPQNSLAWARLAELWMAQRDLDQALEAAKQAATLNPREARAQTVLGFAYLVQIKTTDSKAAFEKAITLAPGAPLPRLGLGLAKIREGDLEGGRREIEIAVSLDPNNSLIRSYLGKAYYEEKRDKLAEVQLKLAKELDPKDPTPYLYDAIRKQTINQPVEALHDIQKSIELNDNRAVYRSKLLLDSDQASRSVSLGRIYDDLGFQQLGLVEGWKSVNMDPTNYSAHRFLSDSYGALPRSEPARLSELLVSQLLQPLNNNPVQPRLGESAPAILAGSGPVDPSYNEFSQLFISDGLHFLGSGIWGENSTLGEEVIQTGLYGKYSYSLAQFHDETDGFRTNNDITQNIYDVFTQISLTPKASIQGEYRYNETKNGDIDLRFDPDNFSSALEMKTYTRTYRFGFHYALTPKSDFLVSAFYQNLEENQFNSISVSTITSKAIIKGYNDEAQYLFRTRQWSLIIGAGRFAGEDKVNIGITFDPIFGLPPLSIESDDHLRQTNFYAYSYIHLPFNATLTLGASEDLYDGLTGNIDRFNPKFGLIWNLTHSTTLRLAGFKVLKKSIISNQTIEPTQVAGFQQFFEDGEGTDSKEYGIGIDQIFTSDLFGGLEFTKRDLELRGVQVLPDGTTEIIEDSGRSQTGRAYLYWTPLTWMAASAEYYYDRSDSVEDDAPTIKTHRVPLALNLYYPCGFFAKLKTTYIDQYGNFFEASSGNNVSGRDSFWIWDASIGYRLPKRFGIFTIGAQNMFDRSFQFQEIDPKNPLVQPDRFIFTKLTLAF